MTRAVQAHVALVFSQIGELGVALEASRVSDITMQAANNTVDVAAVMQASVATMTHRRHAVVKSAAGSCAVLLGEDLRLREIPLQALHPVPKFLLPWSRSVGVLAVVYENGRWSLLLDPDSLSRLVA